MAKASWPEPSRLDVLCSFLEAQIDEGMVWKEVRRTFKRGIATRTYGFERDSHHKVKHPEHFLKPTHLLLEFNPDFNLVTIEFLCIPDSERGKGVGTRIVERLEQEARELGYIALTLNSMAESESFWQKNGFQPVDQFTSRYPRGMVKLLFPDISPEQFLCQL